MKTERIPFIPIPPSTEVKVYPRPLLARIMEQRSGDSADSNDAVLADPAPLEGAADRVEFSSEGRSYTSARELIQATLAQLAPQGKEASSMPSARGEFEARFEAQADASPEETARLMLSGLTGFIYDDFQSNHPGMTASDLDGFHQEAVRAIRAGSEQAARHLKDQDLYDAGVEQNLDATVGQVLSGLDRFVAEERGRLSNA